MAKKRHHQIVKKIKKIHKATLVLVVVFALLGVGVGFGSVFFITKNDVFKINGNTQITLNIGDEYVELGTTCIAFGKDISSIVEVEGEVDTSVEGKYVITYTVNHFRFSRHKLYKLVNVVASDEV